MVDCWHVTIANCTIDSGDDSICLKSGNSRGVNDLLVKNCTITESQSNGLKFGTASTGPFTNITFQDCTRAEHLALGDGGRIGGRRRDQRCHLSADQFFLLPECHLHHFGQPQRPAVPGSVNGITFRDITGSGMTDTRGCPISRLFHEWRDLPIEEPAFRQCEHFLRRRVGFRSFGASGIRRAISRKHHMGKSAGIWILSPARDPCDLYELFHQRGFPGRPALARDQRRFKSNHCRSAVEYFPSGTNVVLQWPNAFTLQTATNVAGPYADMPERSIHTQTQSPPTASHTFSDCASNHVKDSEHRARGNRGLYHLAD